MAEIQKKNLKQLAYGMPKTELHLHIEGTLEPDMAFNLLQKYNMLPLKIPKSNGTAVDEKKQETPSETCSDETKDQSYSVVSTLAELKQVYKFDDLVSFLNIYNTLNTCLKCEEDFMCLANAFAQKSYHNNVIHCEIFFDPQTHISRGIPFSAIVDGLNKGFTEYRNKGMTFKIIAAILRDHSVGKNSDLCFDINSSKNYPKNPSAWTTVKQVIAYNKSNRNSEWKILGIGLDNAEVGFPPKLFKEVYGYAIMNGLLPFAHAGEEGECAYVWEAIQLCNVVRIDHGVRCIEDKKLLAYLSVQHMSDTILRAYNKESRIPLTCCPLSNYKLDVFSKPEMNNLLQLLDYGVMVTVNSDDPAYFGGYANAQFDYLIEMFDASEYEGCYRGIKVQDLYQLCLNGINASVLDRQVKLKYLEKAANYFCVETDLLAKEIQGQNTKM